MYADPSLIRDNVIKLRLNDSEAKLVDAIVEYTGQQKAALLRELLLEQARLVLAGDSNFGLFEQGNEVPAAAPVGH